MNQVGMFFILSQSACHVANHLYKYLGTLRQHIKTVHSLIEYKCEKCGKSYGAEKTLKNHIFAVHDESGECKCESCGKTFTALSSLKSHMRIVHEGIRNHKCEAYYPQKNCS